MNSSGKKTAPCLAVLGTGSDVGKSIVVAALCRIFSNMGMRVAPFKAQNMSNNSFVTPDGGEMGRAQVVQAEAARAEIHTDMNPVLLKPCTDIRAQVVLHGRPMENSDAAGYFADTDALFAQAKFSLSRLRSAYDMVVMEGAGSCAEVNLMERDFVNFRMAREADAPVILVADIDRGGVFAQIVGTLEVIPPEEKRWVQGIIINKFRGDPSLFEDGIAWIEQRTGVPVLGLIPYFRHIEIDSEDGVPLDIVIDPPFDAEPGKITATVLRLPHISNFTDFAPLGRDPWVNLHYLSRLRSLQAYDVVFLPGSKNVRADLDWMRFCGWDEEIRKYASRDGLVVGICGGYQMLGTGILDPHGIEGTPGATRGLCLLDVTTTLRRDKTLARLRGICEATNEKVEGYEIHMGSTERHAGTAHAIRVTSRQGRPERYKDGAVAANGRVWGTYIHGVFDLPGFRQAFLKGINPDYIAAEADAEPDFKERQYQMLAQHFRSHLDMNRLMDIVFGSHSGESDQGGLQ